MNRTPHHWSGTRTSSHRSTMLIAALALTAAVLSLTIYAGTAAHATNPGPTNVVFWAIPGTFDSSPTSGNAFSNGPQDFHSYGKGKHLDTEPQIALECGVWYQVDSYKKGHPFGPGSTLAGGHEDGEWLTGNPSWRFVYGGDCPPEKPEPLTGKDKTSDYVCVDPANGTGVTTTTKTRWTQDYVLVDGEWVLGDKEYDKPVTHTKVSADEDCIPDAPAPESGEDVVKADICTDPANGTRTYTTTTTAWTQDYTWSQDSGEWVLSDKEYAEPVITTSVKEDEDCIPVQPDTLEGEAVTAVYICTDPADGTGTTTTTTTAWTQGHSWDQDAGEWILDDKVYGDPVTTSTVTDDPECIPDAPESKSGTDSESYDYCTEPADGTRTYVMTETAWAQTSVWDQEAGQWILGEKVYGEPFETETVVADSECAVPEEELETPERTPEPPTAGEAPPAAPVTAEATYTG